ncbi:quercetin dioxygenase-like cupin family protein [Rhizobium leguminosarum]|uniref:Quercetin dioxygenase-like cupin family protein n=1 Tax=Rhizobium leguminosarum TaxID=384 RepID=A0A7W9ZSM3_RHILE|nr:quercetin dioxygenase-like cupin family protein [Rhizobium leguminosarum]
MSASNPKAMTVSRPGRAVRSPEGVATAPFWVEMLLEGSADGENTAMRATLDPGTITRWHTHPRGQLLYVLSGHGLAQSEGGPVAELRAGDVPSAISAFRQRKTAASSNGCSRWRPGHDRHAI